MSVQELENAIRQLSHDEFTRLARWIDEYRAEQWDRQIEGNILAGRLDEAGRRADEDFEAGRAQLIRDVKDARHEFTNGHPGLH